MRLNRLQEAGHWYRESLRAKADHVPAHLTYAKLLSITVSPTQNLQTHRHPDDNTVSTSFTQPTAGGTPPPQRKVLLKVSSVQALGFRHRKNSTLP